MFFPGVSLGPTPGRVWPSSLPAARPRAVVAGSGSVAGVPCRSGVAGGAAPGGLARAQPGPLPPRPAWY